MNFRKNVLLADYSNYKIGGPSKFFIEVKTKDELKEALSEWKEISSNLDENLKKVFVLGKGTNVLFEDQGFNGLVIRLCIEGINRQGNKVIVGAGTDFSKLIDFCIENSLTGLEWAGGLPGTVGGAVRGNAGAFKGETKDRISKVESLDIYSQEIKERDNSECDFSYRQSIFKSRALNEVILNAEFSLEEGDREEIVRKVDDKKNYRSERHPLEYPNLGSMFKNVPWEMFPGDKKKELEEFIKNDPFPVIPTAKLIFLAGLKGRRVGDVMVSEKHTNFIVNLGNGKSSQVKELINIVKNEIKEKFGVNLEEEIMYLNS